MIARVLIHCRRSDKLVNRKPWRLSGSSRTASSPGSRYVWSTRLRIHFRHTAAYHTPLCATGITLSATTPGGSKHFTNQVKSAAPSYSFNARFFPI